MDCDLRHPQMAEHFLEVPTVLSLALLQQQYAEQIVDNPASRGRGRRGGIQGFFPGQSSTAGAVDIPVPRGVLQGFLPGEGSSASSSYSPGAADDAGQGYFRTFPLDKKSATVPPHSWSELPPHSSSWTSAAYALPTVLEKEERRRRVQEEAAEAMDQARLLLEQAVKRRKRKKKRKKKVPRTSSCSSCGRARRRQRRWHARDAGFSW